MLQKINLSPKRKKNIYIWLYFVKNLVDANKIQINVPAFQHFVKFFFSCIFSHVIDHINEYQIFTVNVLKFKKNPVLFLFLNKMLLIQAGIYKILVRIVNMEDSDQPASSEAV